MLLLNSRDVRSLIDMDAAIEASARAFVWTARGEAVTPVRHAIGRGAGEAVTLFMPGYVPHASILGLKIGSLAPGNPERGLPATICTILLADPATGEAAAVIEATWLTALRTGAGVGAATKALSPPGAARAAMIGAGGMAYHMVEAMLAACPSLQEMTIYNRTPERAAALRDQADADFRGRCSFRTAATVEACVADADVVTACTSSAAPVIRGAWIKPGAHVNLAGAHGREMREGDDALIERCQIFTVDKLDAASASGEVAIPLENGSLPRTKIVEIGAVIGGAAAGRKAASDITVFKSVGIAAQDLATAAVVIERARSRGLGTTFDLDPAGRG